MPKRKRTGGLRPVIATRVSKRTIKKIKKSAIDRELSLSEEIERRLELSFKQTELIAKLEARLDFFFGAEKWRLKKEAKRYVFCQYTTVEKLVAGLQRMVKDGTITDEDDMAVKSLVVTLKAGPDGKTKDFPYPVGKNLLPLPAAS